MGISKQDHDKILFVAKLGRSLHEYGSNAHKIETILKTVSSSLKMDAQFFSTPTSLVGSFRFPGEEYGVLERCAPGSVHLERICLINDVADQVLQGKMNPYDGVKRLEAIDSLEERYPAWVMLATSGFASLSVSIVLGAGLFDLLPSFVIGLLVGVISLLSSKLAKLAHLGDIFCAFFGAVIAAVSSYFFPSISEEIVLLAGLIYLMPGLSITVATVELATQNYVAGSARLVGAGMGLLKILIGVMGGSGLVSHYLPRPHHLPHHSLPDWLQWGSILISAISFAILFRAHIRDIIWIIITAFTVSIAYKVGNYYAGVQLAAFAGALSVSAGSNLFARLLNRPVSIIQFPGILFLVPGLVSYRSLNMMASSDVISGVHSAVSVGIIAMIIVGGLLCGNVLINPKREL
ncbi:MAG: threonine/serine exporter family protein [Oligoflexia bacterium]|nr:threonine/serine exporter family protein [Oligoflexia bacterium]MBF0366457.1 threonine/serine exporter family protein [Oligoflexia bacterium]